MRHHRRRPAHRRANAVKGSGQRLLPFARRLPSVLRHLRRGRRAVSTGRQGRKAERRAERYLARRGLKTLARNYTRRGGEIDLVMLHGETVVFVEVRFRGHGAWSGGLESVHGMKQRRLSRTAALFLEDHPEHRHRAGRFDVVAASRGKYGIVCEWIADAFDAMDG